MKHNWEYKRLGEVCDINFGKRIVAKETNPGQYFVYGGGGATFTTQTYNREDCMIVSRFAMSPICVRYVKGKFFLNDSGLSVASADKRLLQSFVDKYLWNSQKEIFNLGRGAAQKNLNVNRFMEIQLPVPPMEIQEHIVAELDELNGVIDAKREQLKQLDLLAQSIFYTMFGDPVTNPKGWKTTKWELLFDTILGKMLDKNKQIDSDEILPYLANQNVQWGSFNLDNLNTMKFSVKEKSKFKLKKGDILICEGGESGRCAIWQDDESDILFQKAVHRARIKDLNAISPYFIRFWVEYLKKNDGLKNYIVKSTIEHLTGMKLKTLPVHVPPLSLQQLFAVKVEAIEAQKADIEASIKELQTLLDSRMDYWFN